MCTSKTMTFLVVAPSGVLLTGVTAQGQTVWYVDDDAPAGGDGSTWVTAYDDLQDALGVAIGGDEIRVATGTYTPDGGSGDRLATFQLINGVPIYGGYAGCGAPDPDERDMVAYETVLSGDLFGNDGPDFANNIENSYHVVTGSGCDETAVLDGFTITGGNAEGSGGGGMSNNAGSPTVLNSEFSRNLADNNGGGMYNYGGSPTLINCTFSENWTWDDGGGMSNWNSGVTLTNCIFLRNSAAYGGGGMHNYGGTPTLINCMFSGNLGYRGGGMHNSSHLTLINCTFASNSANYHGGGGGMYNSTASGDLAITSCVFWGNTDNGGTEQSAQIDGTPPFLRYCCVQGWTGSWGGIWNNGNDPLFVDADGPDDIPGTQDDNLRVLAGSSCIDSGDNDAVLVWVTADLDGNPRFLDDPDTPDTGNGTPPIVDRGPYEYHFADCNGNGIPDEQDIAAGTSEDCNTNGTPDECDVAHCDCNTNGVPDECDPDFDGDGTPDDCDSDVDGDGVPNATDVCPFSPLDEPVNPWGGPMGDLDDDCDADLDDYFYFDICLWLSGPGGDPGFQECLDVFDFDADDDVDLNDFAGFQRAFTVSAQ